MEATCDRCYECKEVFTFSLAGKKWQLCLDCYQVSTNEEALEGSPRFVEA